MNTLRFFTTTLGRAVFVLITAATIVVLVTVGASQIGSQRRLGLVDFTGKVTPLRGVPASIFGVRVAPDGKRVTYRADGTIWVADLFTAAPPRRLTTEYGNGPIWSRDGERIAFISMFKGMEALFWRRADGSEPAELLAERARAPESWAADNQSFTYITLVGPSGDAGDYDIWTYSIRDKKVSPLIVVPRSAQSGSRLSPDGRWIAYESNETGRAEVFVEPLPRTGQRFQITKTGGARPLWAVDMSKLYFDNNAADMRIISVGIKTQPAFTWTAPEALPIKDFLQPTGTYRRQYDLMPDGKQLLAVF